MAVPGGGHSRYCFTAAISTDTKQVVSYGIACNSCPLCTEYANKLRDDKISFNDYEVWLEKHKLTCPAEFSHLLGSVGVGHSSSSCSTSLGERNHLQWSRL